MEERGKTVHGSEDDVPRSDDVYLSPFPSSPLGRGSPCDP